MKSSSKEIIITWDGPYDYEEVIDGLYENSYLRGGFGLYQIYGPHPLYTSKKRPGESEVILYIGQTTKTSAFSGRVSAHGFCHNKQYKIFLGRLLSQEYISNERQWIEDILDSENVRDMGTPMKLCVSSDVPG